jgi:hypothetical protein
MAQGDNKTGQIGTNAMFVMTHNKISHAMQQKKFTYGILVDRPQKEFPHRIWIIAGGNLINYVSSASVQTADLDTAKINWNSMLSTALAKCMCLDIKIFLFDGTA